MGMRGNGRSRAAVMLVDAAERVLEGASRMSKDHGLLPAAQL